MLAVQATEPMAKKKSGGSKMGRPTTGRNDVTAKIDADVMKLVKAASSLSGKTVAQYLSEAVRPIAERDVKRLTSHLGESEK